MAWLPDADLAYTPAWKLREMVLSRQVSPVELAEMQRSIPAHQARL